MTTSEVRLLTPTQYRTKYNDQNTSNHPQSFHRFPSWRFLQTSPARMYETSRCSIEPARDPRRTLKRRDDAAHNSP
eukprot:6193051-Pleurochrysis_carterae.AAC.1